MVSTSPTNTGTAIRGAYADSKAKRLSAYFDNGRTNSPQKIGYVMKLIRELRPLTMEEWRMWYLENIHDTVYLEGLTGEMYRSIQDPANEGLTYKDCQRYIYDILFRRTFLSYNKEKVALNLLRIAISPKVEEAPYEWSWKYNIDFIVKKNDDSMIGIQIQPEIFLNSRYNSIEKKEKKHAEFKEINNASIYELLYKKDDQGNVSFTNMDVLENIRRELEPGMPRQVSIRSGTNLDFKALQELIEMSRRNDQRTSFPFIVQAKTGQKYIVWFTYAVDEADPDASTTHVDRVFMISHNGQLTATEVGMEAPFSFTGKQKLSYGEYLIAFAQLYKNFSVNKMNSLLWEKAYRPLYETYRQVSSWARIAGSIEKQPKPPMVAVNTD